MKETFTDFCQGLHCGKFVILLLQKIQLFKLALHMCLIMLSFSFEGNLGNSNKQHDNLTKQKATDTGHILYILFVWPFIELLRYYREILGEHIKMKPQRENKWNPVLTIYYYIWFHILRLSLYSGVEGIY